MQWSIACAAQANLLVRIQFRDHPCNSLSIPTYKKRISCLSDLLMGAQLGGLVLIVMSIYEYYIIACWSNPRFSSMGLMNQAPAREYS